MKKIVIKRRPQKVHPKVAQIAEIGALPLAPTPTSKSEPKSKSAGSSKESLGLGKGGETPPLKERELSAKEEMFCQEYLKDFNGTQAAIRSGYSKRSAKEQASRMLTKANILERLRGLLDSHRKEIHLDVQYIINGFMEVVERCMQRKPVMVFDATARAMVQVKDEEGNDVWQFDSSGANKALTKLGEYMSMVKKVFANDPDNPLFPNIKITRATKPDDSK